jgi:hypothetical protein
VLNLPLSTYIGLDRLERCCACHHLLTSHCEICSESPSNCCICRICNNGHYEIGNELQQDKKEKFIKSKFE